MGFGFRIAPGVRVRVSSRLCCRGWPKGCAVDAVGGYRAGFSTGAGPFTAYHSVGGRRRAPSRAKRRRSARTAGSGNYLGKTAGRPETNPLSSSGNFPAVQAPVAPPIDEVDERAIKRRHQRAGTTGASWFARPNGHELEKTPWQQPRRRSTPPRRRGRNRGRRCKPASMPVGAP